MIYTDRSPPRGLAGEHVERHDVFDGPQFDCGGSETEMQQQIMQNLESASLVIGTWMRRDSLSSGIMFLALSCWRMWVLWTAVVVVFWV